jgi:parallel beta-helix repeat protein
VDKIEGLKGQSFCTKVIKAVEPFGENILGAVILLFLVIMAGSAGAAVPTFTEITPSFVVAGTDGLTILASDHIAGSRYQDMLQSPGRLEAKGMHFEINDSNYLNITLDSSETINITLESAPKMVTIKFESASGLMAAKITLGGFVPLTTYNKYEDNYHNLVSFQTDTNGNYTYTQELSKPHFVFIQPETGKLSNLNTLAISPADMIPSTIFIKDNATGGDCILIGTWNISSKTCTMTTDLTSNIQIDNDSITLDGNGHTITGSGTGNGVYLSGRSEVTIKDLNANKFYNGIFLYSSSNNMLSRNNISLNGGDGISLWSSNNNTLSKNIASSNYGGIYLYYYSSFNTLSNDNALNNKVGIYLSYGNNILNNNNASNNSYYGISLGDLNNNNKLSNNTASNNNFNGIVLGSSSFNILNNNTALNNNISGIILYFSSNNNTLSNNNASNNNYNGISLNFSCNNNTLSNNNASNNKNYGISLSDSGNNLIYNNYFNNTNNAFDNGNNIWNIPKTSGTNIINGAFLGGNFWSDYAGKDTDGDGLGDTILPYNSSGEIAISGDIHPLVFVGENNPPISICGPNKLKCENVGAPVQFNGTASYDPDGVIVSYAWDFGDSVNGTGVVPKHTYTTYRWNGSAYLPFIVNLTVTDNNGLTNSTSQKVIIWIAGDANGNGKVNILDASLVGIKWAGTDPCSDLNNDGKVNILDASIIGLNWGKIA